MFSLLYGLWQMLFRKAEYHILVLGLDEAGKSTLLERLKKVYVSPAEGIPLDRVTPTVGLNIGKMTIQNSKIVFWDLGGQKGLRTIWDRYYKEAHGLVFVLDAANPDRVQESKEAMEHILGHPDFRGVPVLLLANKNDIAPTSLVDDVIRSMALQNTAGTSRQCQIEACSALTGEGVEKGIDWLAERIKENPRNTKATDQMVA